MNKEVLKFENDLATNQEMALEFLEKLKKLPAKKADSKDKLANMTATFAQSKGYSLEPEDVHAYLDHHFKIKISAAEADNIAAGSKRGFDSVMKDIVTVAAQVLPAIAGCL